MTSFDYSLEDERQHKRQVKTEIKDKEGIDFEAQLLSHRKFKTTLEMYNENTGQEKLDARRYFPRNQIKELILNQEDTAPNKEVEFVDDDDNRGNSRGGYKSKKRGGYQRKKILKLYMLQKMLQKRKMKNFASKTVIWSVIFNLA